MPAIGEPSCQLLAYTLPCGNKETKKITKTIFSYKYCYLNLQNVQWVFSGKEYFSIKN
jgi:hypothetical protein